LAGSCALLASFSNALMSFLWSFDHLLRKRRGAKRTGG
jgi:hypothetical protein